MNKQEFIDSLRRNLSSINDYNFVNDTVSYYENYIESQIRMGKSLEEVMQQLGDPRLIAKSIKATRVSEDSQQQNAYHEYDEDAYSDGKKSPETIFHFNGRVVRMPAWLIKTISVLVIIVVLLGVFTVLRWLSPFIVMGLFAYVIYRAFFGKY